MHLADQAEFSKNIKKIKVFLRFLHVLLHLRKLGPGWLMLAHAGPSGPQVGTKWTPSWPKLAPSWPWNDVLGRLGRQVGFGTTPSCPWNDVLGQNGLLKALRARSLPAKFLYRLPAGVPGASGSSTPVPPSNAHSRSEWLFRPHCKIFA